MQLRWLGTAGFELISGSTSVLIDPYLTRNDRAKPQQTLRPADFSHVRAILITHGHFDHTYDVPALVQASGAPVFASPLVCQALAAKGVAWNKLRPRWGGETDEVGPFRFTAVPACHVNFDAHLVVSTLWHCLPQLPHLAGLGYSRYPQGQVLGWLIEVEEKRLFHLGSACMREDVDGDIDLFMVPVQGRTDICSVAAALVKRVGPRVVIPHHHDDFYPRLSRDIDLTPFKTEVEGSGAGVKVLVPDLNKIMEPLQGA